MDYKLTIDAKEYLYIKLTIIQNVNTVMQALLKILFFFFLTREKAKEFPFKKTSVFIVQGYSLKSTKQYCIIFFK